MKNTSNLRSQVSRVVTETLEATHGEIANYEDCKIIDCVMSDSPRLELNELNEAPSNLCRIALAAGIATRDALLNRYFKYPKWKLKAKWHLCPEVYIYNLDLGGFGVQIPKTDDSESWVDCRDYDIDDKNLFARAIFDWLSEVEFGIGTPEHLMQKVDAELNNIFAELNQIAEEVEV